MGNDEERRSRDLRFTVCSLIFQRKLCLAFRARHTKDLTFEKKTF